MAIRNLVSFQRPSVNSFRYNEEYSHETRSDVEFIWQMHIRRRALVNCFVTPLITGDGYDEESRSIRKLCKFGSKDSRKIELYDEV